LFEARERHVDLARVHGLGQRSERKLKPGAQLIAVRRLLGQQREQDFLDDPELVALRRLLARYAHRFWHQTDLSNRYLWRKITVIYVAVKRRDLRQRRCRVRRRTRRPAPCLAARA